MTKKKPLIWATKDLTDEEKKDLSIREYQKLKGGYAFEEKGKKAWDPALNELVKRDNKIRKLRRIRNTLLTHGAYHISNREREELRLLKEGAQLSPTEVEAFEVLDRVFEMEVKEQQIAVLDFAYSEISKAETHKKWLEKKEAAKCGVKNNSKPSKNTRQEKKPKGEREKTKSAV